LLTERIYPFYHGGAEEVMFDYAKILAKNNKVTVYTSFDKGTAKRTLDNVNFYYLSKKIKRSNRKGNHSLIGVFSFAVSALLKKRRIINFDVVILDSIHYFYPLLFLKHLKRKNKKVVTIFYEAWYGYRKSRGFPVTISFIMGLSIKRLIHYSDAMISISDPTTRSLIENYNADKDKVFTIPLGIDLDHIYNNISLKPLNEREYDVTFVGRFAAIKRISDLIDAISIIVNSGRSIKVALIGDGPQMGLIQKKVSNLELINKVYIFGFVDENIKYSILNNSKLFILPSEREGFSLSTLEAMALGCIPVVSKPKFDEVFGVSHFVKNGESGMYYSVGNVNELAQDISSCLDDLETSTRMSSSAVKTARLYTISEMARRIYDTLEQMTS
jgi:glycosyltransferase involved in cell wall biosynthesis